jgi:non-homologous end joining protein Ku
VRSSEIVPLLRELYSRRPETRDLEPYELQSILWSLNYTDELVDEANIAAAIEVARTDFDPDEGAA